MGKLQTLKSNLQTTGSKVKTLQPGSYRIRGRALQHRRMRIWKANPHCAECGKLVTLAYPHHTGFELDHIIPVSKGGSDTDDNCQILCMDGCHAKKTAKDMTA